MYKSLSAPQLMSKNLLNRLFSAVASFSLLVNSFSAPLTVLAQEVTPDPTPIVEETPTPTPTEEPTITPEATPTPTEEITPTPTEKVTPTPTVEETVTPTPTPSEEQPAQQSESQPSQEVTGEPTPTPEVAVEEPKEQGIVDAVILHNTSASSISEYDFDYQTDGSATLTTDKADYSPTDTVLITGTGFIPNETYTLEITSDTGNFKFSDRVTSDESGNLFYSYQLDGTYRPNYKVEIKNGDAVVAMTTFTDTPTSGCTEDSAGANDLSGQKDLTKMCVTYGTTSDAVTWNWDQTGWSGENSGDACSLYDTDGDGFANYSLCVVVKDTPATFDSRVLYSCGDASAFKCTNPIVVISSPSSSCTASVTATDPFGAGDNFPNDTTANCTVQLSDFSPATSAALLDVCSYPSQEPNSAPSDCIVFKSNTGRLEVVKDLIPSSDTGLFNLQINGTTEAPNVGDGGTTDEKLLTITGQSTVYTVGETAGTGTSLSSYTSGIVCKDTNGTGSIVAQSTNAGPLNVTLHDNDDIVCTITNTRHLGTIIVHKDVQGPDGQAVTDASQNFTVRLDGSDPQTIIDGGTVTYSNVPSGVHTITETVIPTGYIFYSFTPDSDTGTLGAQVSVTTGQTTDVYVVNSQNNATVTIHKDVINPDGSDVSDGHQFTTQKDGGSDQTIAELTDAVYTVAPGSYTFTEVSDTDYTLYSITGDNDANAANGATLTVGPGGSAELTFVNKQKTATINVYKDVVKPDGQSPVSDTHHFTALLNGGTGQSFWEGSPTSYTVNPGQYTITEDTDNDYTNLGCRLVTGAEATNFNTPSNSTINVTCKNAQKSATITVYKNVIKYDESEVVDNNIFSVTLNSVLKDFSENGPAVYTVDPGTYSAVESAEANYSEFSNDSPETVGSNGSGTIYIVNKQDPLSISGYKFDADGQTGLEGWTIKLYSCLEQALDCSLFGTTSTNSIGAYIFEGLSTGFYQVYEELIAGWTNLLSAIYHDITLTTPGQNSEDNNFVNFKLGQITACKYSDLNGNGLIDREDTTLSDVTINLSVWDEEWSEAGSQPTGQNGCVTFSGLSAGDYRVGEIVPTGYYQSSPHNPDYFGLSVESGTDETRNFLNAPYRTISGQKYEDVNGNGQKDAGEPGLEDWTIYMDNNFNGILDGGDVSTTTDGNGNYEFANLVSDLYRIREVIDPGWTQTEPTIGYYDADVHEDLSSEGNDFGNFKLASIGDFIWQDNNGDGVQDAGEPGIAGIQVNLYLDDDGTPGLNTSTDTLIGSETTDGSGGYVFEDLGPGSYWTDVVDSTLPVGFVNTTPDPYGPIVLSSGEVYLLADVGYVPPEKEIRIEKSNDKSGGANAGDTVTYTLTVMNTGNVVISDVIVTDSLPGGFEYVDGSTSILGASTVEPTKFGSTLKWDIGTVSPEEPVTITYQATISSDLPAGTYKNYATCSGQVGGILEDGIDGLDNFLRILPETVPCNTDDSDVPVGQNLSYGGQLTPQVLGASTELPATGSKTSLLLFALIVGGFGVFTKIRAYQLGRKNHAKN